MSDGQFSFEELRKIQLAEKHYSVLAPLAEDYYDTYGGYIEQYKKQLQQSYDLQSAKVYENAQLIVKDIVNTRLQKIILRAVRDSQSGKLNTDGLARQEKEFYLKTTNLLREYTESITKAKPLAGQTTQTATEPTFTQPNPANTPNQTNGQIQITILIDLPEFVGPAGAPIGPFTKGQTVQLDEKDAQLLIKRGAAKTN